MADESERYNPLFDSVAAEFPTAAALIDAAAVGRDVAPDFSTAAPAGPGSGSISAMQALSGAQTGRRTRPVAERPVPEIGRQVAAQGLAGAPAGVELLPPSPGTLIDLPPGTSVDMATAYADALTREIERAADVVATRGAEMLRELRRVAPSIAERVERRTRRDR